MMSAPLDTTGLNTRRAYAVSRDGKRFPVIAPGTDRDTPSLPLTIVVNWLSATPT
jgi:hypothetical protein